MVWTTTRADLRFPFPRAASQSLWEALGTVGGLSAPFCPETGTIALERSWTVWDASGVRVGGRRARRLGGARHRQRLWVR